MRAFNIIAGGLVFICMLILSYSHTAELFARGGYYGGYAHIGVVACELLFFLSNTNIILCKLKGWKVPVPIRLASLVSALVVGYANVSSGFNRGWEAVAIGGLILVVLVVSELVVSAAIMSANADSKSSTLSTNTTAKDTKHPDRDTTTDNTATTGNTDTTDNTATTDNTDTAAEHKRTTDATATGYTAAKTAEEDNATNADTTDDSTSNTDDAEQPTTTAANTKPVESAKTARVLDMMERKQKRKRVLDSETIKKIYLAEGSNAAIGRKYGVNAETVRRIKLGLRHAEITAPLRNAK